MKTMLAVVTAVTSLSLTGCSTTQNATTWEYRMAGSISEVNLLSEQGWTVVNFSMPGQGGPNQYLMKHAKP
jgi:outer membrane lipoprotein SlyB